MQSKLIGPLLVGWSLLARNRPRAFILAAGSLSIALAAASITAAAVTSQAVVVQTVDVGWRGTYDLLVRPANVTALSNGGRTLVPSDFLSARSSGITRAQWQEIVAIPGVEVAAPLATLGWIRPDVVGLNARFAVPGRGELIRVDATVQNADGTIERDAGYLGLDYANQTDGIPSEAISTFHNREWDESSAHVGLWLSLPSAWGDVVGIDPIEEDRLVGLDRYITGESLQRGLTTKYDDVFGVTATSVPIIAPAHTNWPGQVTMSISRITGVDIPAVALALRDPPAGITTIAEFNTWEVGRIEQLTQSAEATVLNSKSSDLGDLIQPLRYTLLTFTGGQFVLGEEGGGGSATGRNVVLLSDDTPYGFDPQGNPTLDSLGPWGEIVEPAIDAAQADGLAPPSASLNEMIQYRPLSVILPDPFVVDPLGTYDLEAIASRYAGATNYVPLGIYGDPARTLVTDVAGQRVDETLPVSMNPGGLNPLPPIGLTNLETVEALRGPQFIDAIRVRVADITSYSPDAVDRIAQVAAAIHDRTGLHVDVVAGSSPVDVDVQVAGVGTVRERWTTLGEAPRIVSGAEGLSGLLLIGAGLVVLLYLGSFGVFLVDDQRRGLEILRQVGWRQVSRAWLPVSQALLLALASAALSVAMLAMFDATTEVSLPIVAYPVAALAVIGAHMAAAGLAALTAGGRRERTVAEPARWLRLGVVRFGLRNSLEAPRRLLTVAIALALAITIASTIAAVEVAYGGQLRATVLGELVWLRVGWYHLLAAGAALFAAASIALDSGVLAVERRVGLIALLRATGWRARAIGAVVCVEVGLPAFAGGLIAVVPVVAIGAWVGLGPLGLIVLGTAAVAFGGLVALVVAALPVQLALAVEPARGLAAEGMSGALPGFASRAALTTIVALALFVSGAGVGYGVLAPAAIPANAFVPVPTLPPPSAESLALSAHVEAIAAHPDRAYGSTSLDWTLGYIADFLAAHGGQTSDQDFVSYQATWFDAAGNAVDENGLFGRGLAVTSDFAADLPAAFTATTSDEPDCAVGVMVLRASDSSSPALSFDTLARCEVSGATAVLAVRAVNDESWTVATTAGSVQLTGGSTMWATVGSPTDSTPLLVVPIGSTGPGAAQSAGPIAVALELAAKAEANHLPLRLVFAELDQRGALAVIARRIAQTMPAAPVIELGPLGGRMAAVLGVHWTDTLDEVGARASLLATVVFDEGAAAWVERTADLAANDTSDTLLTALRGGTSTDDVRLEGIVAFYALTVGVDAAYLGEPLTLDTDTGTPADTANQLDISAPEHVLTQLTDALKVLDGD